MQDLQIFKNEQFGEIRTLTIDNEPYFVGKDVAVTLGYSNTRDALSKHVDSEDKADVAIHDGSQNRNMVVINESGLYSLILSSKLPTAKKFKRWVTSEVLPSIRKTGTYAVKQPKENGQAQAKLAEAKLNNSRARVSSMWLKIAKAIPLPEYQQICASYASKALAGSEVIPLPEAKEKYYTATEVGEMFGVTSQKVGRIANKNGLKTSEYGKLYHDKSKYSAKEVDTFKYNEKGVQAIGQALKP